MASSGDADVRLLRAWRNSNGCAGNGGWIPARELSAAARLSTEETVREIEVLCAAGYTIEHAATAGTSDVPGHDGGSYRLADVPNRLIAADLVAGLPADGVIGRQITVFEETGSTNDVAAQAGADGLPEGLVIFAETQRSGRGRLGRSWQSTRYQGLWFSVLLRPPAALRERWPELTFSAALAVAEAAEEVTGRPATIKWPNDVQMAGRKISGILLESHHRRPPGFVVVGIGLNVLQREGDFAPELRGQAASLLLSAAPGRQPARGEAAIAVLLRLEHHYRDWPANFSAVERACRSRGCIEPVTG